MSEARIHRYTQHVAVVASTATSQGTTIRLDDAAGMMVSVAGASTAATRLAVYGSHDDVTYAAVHGSDGAAAEVVLVSGTSATYPLPDAAFALRYVRLVADADLGTGASVTVSVKS